MLYTVTNSGLQNGRPTQIGSNTISVAYQGTHIFSLSDFTTNTSPVYSDPEGDILSFIKVVTLPDNGTLKLNGVNVSVGDNITSANISSNNFSWVSLATGPIAGYKGIWQFDAADVGSNSLSGLNDGIITMDVSAKENNPPDVVGDQNILLDYGDSYTFQSGDFITNTTPAYNDPEGDAAYKVKVLDLPSEGILVHNGVDVIVNQEILVSEINAGYLVYNPDLGVTSLQNLTFNFAVSDTVNGGFTQ